MVTQKVKCSSLSRCVSTAVLIAVVSTLAGCAGNKSASPMATASTAPLSPEAALADAQALNAAYQKEPDNPVIAMRFAKALQTMGSKNEATKILATTAEKHPKNAPVVVAYGKSLLNGGKPAESIEVLKQARTLNQTDWRIPSALGLAHDQLKRHTEARKYYAVATKIAPQEASIRNNIGLSYALDNDLSSAEKSLQMAVKMKNAEPRVRQNLALIIGLQGRFEEAQKMAQNDMSKDQAEQNVAYLRSMLAEPNGWSQLAEIDKKKRKPGKSKSVRKKIVADNRTRKPLKLRPTDAVGGPLIEIGTNGHLQEADTQHFGAKLPFRLGGAARLKRLN